jgi:hypothetical protein
MFTACFSPVGSIVLRIVYKETEKMKQTKNCFRVGSYHHSHSFFFQRIFSCFFLSFWIILSLSLHPVFFLVLWSFTSRMQNVHNVFCFSFFWNPTGRFAVRRVSNYSPLEKQNWYLWFILRRLDKDIIKAVPFN